MRRGTTAIAALVVLAGCNGPLDYDLRGQLGGFSTTQAAQSATTSRPATDARGVITYPTYQVAVAQRGDSVSDIAARVGLPASELATFNGLNPGDTLREGEVLALPRSVGSSGTGVDIESIASTAIDQAPESGSVRTSTLEPAKPVPAPVPAGPEPIRHKVKRGETAYTISRLYQVPVESLAEWNGLGSDFTVREGQYLLIPVKDQAAPRNSAAAGAAAGAGAAAVTAPAKVRQPQRRQAPPSPCPNRMWRLRRLRRM